MIPTAIAVIALRREKSPYHRLFWLFVAFIASCGLTHLTEAVIFWFPVYRLAAALKLVTAVASWVTVVALVRALPEALELRSPSALQEEVKLQTRRLAREKAVLEGILAQIPVGVVVTDSAGGYWVYNALSESIMGTRLKPVPLEERPSFYEIRTREGALIPKHELPIVRVLDGEDSVDTELCVGPEAASEWRRIATSVRPLHIEGRREGAICVLQDVTEDRLREASLERANRDFERSNRDLQSFAYLASHDLQAPLRMVRSYVELLEKRCTEMLDDKGRRYLSHASEGARRMQALIEDLLRLCRVQTSPVEMKVVALDEVAQAAVENLEPQIEAAAASVTLGALPTVEGSASLLGQVFENLIGNGLKYARPGVPPEVRVEASEEGDAVLIEISDNGVGIPPDKAEEVFGVFRRLDALPEVQGTGIGLAIVARAVEHHGGTVRVVPREGPGAIFEVRLPKMG